MWLPTERPFVIGGAGPRQFDVIGAHRAHFRSIVNAMVKLVDEQVAKRGCVAVLSGGAPGFDYWWAWAGAHVGVPVVLCLPSRQYHTRHWCSTTTAYDENLYQLMLTRAAAIEHVAEDVIHTTTVWSHGGMNMNFVRNLRMVELADAFVGYESGTPGTKHCLAAVREAGLPLRILGRGGG